MPDVRSGRWLLNWCLGSIISPIFAIGLLLPISLGGHPRTSLVIGMTLWAMGVYALGSALGQTRAMGLRKLRRIGWVGAKIVLDLAPLSLWPFGGTLGSGRTFVLVSTSTVLLCGAVLAWSLLRRVDHVARAYAYASVAALLLAQAAITGYAFPLYDIFGHPLGQLILRDIAFGVALWCLGRSELAHA